MILSGFIYCDPGGSRTHNLQNRNLTFYPLNYGAGYRIGNSVLSMSEVGAKLIN